jgi:hypothetical protein
VGGILGELSTDYEKKQVAVHPEKVIVHPEKVIVHPEKVIVGIKKPRHSLGKMGV